MCHCFSREQCQVNWYTFVEIANILYDKLDGSKPIIVTFILVDLTKDFGAVQDNSILAKLFP